ncbi:hypothetical protein [uncultured Roseobacter sp.]|uniref:hypothetical protein n=1 Tax=uncultured Roseobacter sp. TaxID=114847 RepID=UPI00261A1BD4|nr:hypothetical protein [uncultured Roseobacter sp.]
MSPAPPWTSRVAAEPFRFERQGRNRTGLAVVAAIWIALIAATVVLDAAPWLMAVLALFTLPAAWEIVRNPLATLTLDGRGMRWQSGRRSADVALAELERVRLDTRLDFSVRVTLILTNGARVRLPYECTPPHKSFEETLNQRGIATERHHFSLIG